ncbi:hypothetical protein [Novosphingobium sp.]|uniref:hypothetical protein n=1 Tax=Novosphingobium sp. TaxID=1874826 RepID=UPI003340FB7C
MGDIQFAPLQPVVVPRSQPPAWLRAVLDWLAARIAPLGTWLAQHWRAFEIGGAILLVVALAWFGWTMWQGRQRTPRANDDAPAWAPDAAMAAILLADADRLAAEGRFDEAVHLLLRRSFDDIAANRPDLLTPASTAREIAQGPTLPAPARSAFGVIAGEVERSRYALHPLRHDDWQRARAAYAAFAVPARGVAGALA